MQTATPRLVNIESLSSGLVARLADAEAES
jgi:hypothetical protein